MELYGDGVRNQPLRFFPRLRRATDEQRSEWTESYFGLHWEGVDEDIGFESFIRAPTILQNSIIMNEARCINKKARNRNLIFRYGQGD